MLDGIGGVVGFNHRLRLGVFCACPDEFAGPLERLCNRDDGFGLSFQFFLLGFLDVLSKQAIGQQNNRKHRADTRKGFHMSLMYVVSPINPCNVLSIWQNQKTITSDSSS